MMTRRWWVYGIAAVIIVGAIVFVRSRIKTLRQYRAAE
jgi:hypothetical protein